MALNGIFISPTTNKRQLVERKNRILKQHIRLLTSKTTWSGMLKYIHLNDQPAGPIAPYARPGTPAEAPTRVTV